VRELTKRYKIAALPGDGVGKEVIPEAVEIMKEAASRYKSFEVETSEFECGGAYYLEHDREWSEDAERFVKTEADAILLGGIGAKNDKGETVKLPNGNLAGYSVVIGLRQSLDLFANVRPVKLLEGIHSPIADKTSKDIDMVIVRENTEGLYIPARGRLSNREEGDLAVDLRVITAKASERVSRFAYELAESRSGAPVDGAKRVTCVDKSNILAGCRLFRESFDKVGLDFPKIYKDYAYVDAWTLWAIQKPEYYDVVVTTNAFGDIISDLGGALQGGLGISPSANIGLSKAMFEPVHGSAPDIAGKNQANPIAAILSLAMMFDWLGSRHGNKDMAKAAEAIRQGIESTLRDSDVRTKDLCLGRWSNVAASSTSEVASEILKRIKW